MMTTTTTSTPVRHEWFQTDSHLILSIFVKNLERDQVQVEMKPNQVSIQVPLPSDPSRSFCLDYDPLFADIVPEESTVFVGKVKVEIKLKKSQVGLRWSQLEAVQAEETADKPPAYPSSSKKAVDWNQVEKTVEEEKPEGEQALNALFQQIYKDGTDEVKRAMMKSFVESNGTCLSTNWDDVKKGTVDVRPPEGMEAKKWEM